MYYCVRCGDKIDKDELVCDKCGLRFTVVENDGTTVYINRSPIPPESINLKADRSKGKTSGKKKKKSGYGWLVALICVASVVLALVFATVLLGMGIFAGVALFSEDGSEEIVVTEPVSIEADASTQTPITYENNNTAEQSQYFSGAIRDPFVKLKGDGTDTVTVMIYMNGSDLESKYGYATDDLREMLNATLSDNVNVVIQTGGTSKWKTEGISNKHSQRFIVKDGKLELVDDSLSQLDITAEETLRDFITFCSDNYPADRNILILWNHGGGVVYGYGVDEIVGDEYAALTIDEIQRATQDSNVKFEMIGFDACLMGGLETACALYDVTDYLVVSEDFESGNGWEYQNWLSLLGYNSSTPMTDVAKVIIDDFIKESLSVDSEGVLALIDLRYTRLLFSTWTAFAYENEDELLSYDYTMSMQRSDRASDSLLSRGKKKSIWDWMIGGSETMETYCYAVDIMALASTMNTDEANALSTVMKSSVLYCSSTAGDSYMTGLSVTLPYGDYEFYNELDSVFGKCGFDDEYLSFLAKFADADNVGSYDWNSSDFNGWDSYDSEYGDEYWNDYDWNIYDWDSYYSDDYDWDCYDYDDSWYYQDGYYDDCYRDESDGWYYDDPDSWYYDDSDSWFY